jgi:hypothetical protein
MVNSKALNSLQQQELLLVLQARFEKNMARHKNADWANVVVKIQAEPTRFWSLNEMERTGGEPDLVGANKKTGEYIFYDCSPESPQGRRSLCYDLDAWQARKEHKPNNNALDVAAEMGVEILSEEQYRELQKTGPFDTKTSSWIKTPGDIRKLGGALFGDFRFGHVFIYHNGAESFYASRGFRACLRV